MIIFEKFYEKKSTHDRTGNSATTGQTGKDN